MHKLNVKSVLHVNEPLNTYLRVSLILSKASALQEALYSLKVYLHVQFQGAILH
jgi:hypothetical protein